MPDFDWNDLRAFLAIARIGRLTTAARHLGIDHSTLSRRISSLECALATRLFDRRPVGFILTSDGERLLADAERMESLAIQMRSRLDEAGEHVTGTVRLGTPEGFGTYFLAPRLCKMALAQPGLDIELVANPRTFSLSKREADLAVSMTRPETGRVFAKKLVDYALGIYTSQAYLERRGPIVAVADLVAQHWVGYVDDLLWTTELNYFPQISPDILPRLRISNVITQMLAVRGGSGVGVLPHFMARDDPGLVPLFSDEVRLIRSYWMITHGETRDLQRVRLLMDFISREIASVGDAFWLA